MGNIMSAISDDIDDYTDNCRALGVDAKASHGSPDCYGDHAAWVARQLQLKRNGKQFSTEYPGVPKTATKPQRNNVNEVRPFSPDDALKHKVATIPNFVLHAVNELLAERWSGKGSCSVQQKEVIERALEINLLHNGDDLITEDMFYKFHWLDFEPIYRDAGWKVSYDKPAYDENYEPNWNFSKIGQ